MCSVSPATSEPTVQDLEIRRVRNTRDAERFYELLVEYEASLEDDLRHGVVSNVATERFATSETDAAFVAVGEEGRSLGCVAVTPLDPATAVLMRLFVRPEGRGKGLARRLVSAALDFLRDQGYARVVLDTEKDRLRSAYELYASIGFRECDPYGQVDYERPTYMELRL